MSGDSVTDWPDGTLATLTRLSVSVSTLLSRNSQVTKRAIQNPMLRLVSEQAGRGRASAGRGGILHP